MNVKSQQPILIAGGGPVGAIAALALAQQGMPVRLLEAEDRVNDAPRAATAHAATLEMLARLGLIDDVIRNGLIEPRFRIWDRSSNTLQAEFDFGVLREDTPYPFVVQCEQHKLVNLATARLRAMPHAKVDYSSRVTSVRQFDDRVEITVEAGSDIRTVTGSYLIGADGGRSTVRKSLGVDFEGYTHREHFLILTTPFDFGGAYDDCSRNYFTDPDEWCALFKVSGDDDRGLWRILHPTRLDETETQALDAEAAERRMQKFFPKDGRYPLVHRNVYRVHQRVAAKFHDGRVFLAGDSAHVNNPLGGLGLNFGIHDAMDLSDLLVRVVRGDAPPSVLDAYGERRRQLNIEYVQQQTIANKKRMEERDPTARAKNFEELRRVADNPAAHHAYMLRASLIESRRR